MSGLADGAPQLYGPVAFFGKWGLRVPPLPLRLGPWCAPQPPVQGATRPDVAPQAALSPPKGRSRTSTGVPPAWRPRPRISGYGMAGLIVRSGLADDSVFAVEYEVQVVRTDRGWRVDPEFTAARSWCARGEDEATPVECP